MLTQASVPFDMMVAYLLDASVTKMQTMTLTGMYNRSVTYHGNQPTVYTEKKRASESLDTFLKRTNPVLRKSNTKA